MTDTVEIVGSHMKAEAFTGQNGGKNPSSIKIGEKLPRSTVAKSIIAADGSVSAAPGDWQTRPVSSAQAVPTHPAMKGAAKGATVPAATSRADKAGIVRAVGGGRRK